MITTRSRYRREDAYASRDPLRADAPIEGLKPRPSQNPAAPAEVHREHLVVGSDRLDSLAFRYYGDPLKYWLICDANDTLFPDDLLVPGRVLRIPRNLL